MQAVTWDFGSAPVGRNITVVMPLALQLDETRDAAMSGFMPIESRTGRGALARLVPDLDLSRLATTPSARRPRPPT
ncbi:MAG: hypothetical protein JNJ71_18600 [Rubrivivax sp.]|nr:hypothetical protein [Rubrivivax sp.]